MSDFFVVNNEEFEQILSDIVKICAEDETNLIGAEVVEQIVQDNLANKQSILKSYSVPEDGHSMNLYETIIFVFAVTQGVESVVNIVSMLKSKGIINDEVIKSAKDTLQRMYSLSEDRCDRIYQLLKKWVQRG